MNTERFYRKSVRCEVWAFYAQKSNATGLEWTEVRPTGLYPPMRYAGVETYGAEQNWVGSIAKKLGMSRASMVG